MNIDEVSSKICEIGWIKLDKTMINLGTFENITKLAIIKHDGNFFYTRM